ncbi:hypothetical protein HOG75_01900 [bacterium]|jgi:hypothetical protein|nr:hypothetical protein [bacterium]
MKKVFFCCSISLIFLFSSGLYGQQDILRFSLEKNSFLTAGWIITSEQLHRDPGNFEGMETNFWGHHLHLGYGIHVSGVIIKNRFPTVYQKLPNGLKLLFKLGSLIEIDDIYQHLYLQRNDEFGPGFIGGQPATSPIHKFYCWTLRAERERVNWKNMLELLQYKNLSFSAGFYKGPAAELTLKLAEWKRFYVSANYIQKFNYNPKTEIETERGVFGGIVGAKIFKWLKFECGIVNKGHFIYGFKI